MTARDVEVYDLRIISLGAGVQSSALYRMAVMGEIGPRPDYAIFADTQNEPYWVYENLADLEKWGDIPILKPSIGSLGEAVKAGANSTGGRFASVPFWVEGEDGRASLGRRQCTREYKIDVVAQQIRSLLGLKKGERAAGKYRVEQWMGISVDEVQRASPSRIKWITSRWPLLFDKPMRRYEIKAWMAANGFPIPGKSACTFCPYRKAVEYAKWREDEPEVFEEACQWDDLIRSKGTMKGFRGQQYIWRELTPLRELPPLAELAGKDEAQIDMFNDACDSGMCGV